ncbi:hypothetical protein MLD38_003396 [Melastoma candidum]|uniref:Uncharacterized protein n=1 Tax=Melastoma candidum TaxID=119954 RepID=A0ACB9S2G6_9MYRT|nr:hypothetical protein MLD38_003396 [Melastoma candidum]
MVMEPSRACGRSLLVLLLVLGLTKDGIGGSDNDGYFNRNSFPKDFLFGTASSAYQYEGAYNEGGRGPSIWDISTHKNPEKITDRSNGDVADDSYHQYKEDVHIMKDLGFDAYRLSISWSRILPKGKLAGGINNEGVEYYNNLINELLSKGIKPFVTLFHWDLPQPLEDEYRGFLSPKIADDYRDYVDVCFKEFGDRVKNWITLNEPYSYCYGGYGVGALVPWRCSQWQNLSCLGGDSSTEPYQCAHNQLLAHAAGVKLYKEKYQASQKGIIGVTLVSHFFEPYSTSTHDRTAALRSLDFMLGWFLAPITQGDYPSSMRAYVGNRLPKFTDEESRMLKGSLDFVGLNYYTTELALYAPQLANLPLSYVNDIRVNFTQVRNGVPIGQQAASSWLSIYPYGIYELLRYVKSEYNNPIIYITENGVDEYNNSTLTLEQQLADTTRVKFYHDHLSNVKKAIDKGVKVKGYFAWSLLDNYEWSSGYTVRFGINYVDFKNGQKRYPKLSAAWFKKFLHP